VREGVPSITARAVALFRGLGGGSAMRSLFSPRARAVLSAVDRAPFLLTAAKTLTGGLLEHVCLRTAAIDAQLKRALSSGISQLVILGAGLDARAFRMPELAGVEVYEVDHPSTQAFKRARAERLSPTARALHFVGVDFERESIGDRLQQAGHRPQLPTVWIWEGVTMYLEEAAFDATLQVIGDRSAPGSVALITYGDPTLSDSLERIAPLLLAGLKVLGEPMKGRMTFDTLRAKCERHGFAIESHEGSPDWAARQTGPAPSRWIFSERLISARKIS
jgi:methyltransferase (TIGR00027 family)